MHVQRDFRNDSFYLLAKVRLLGIVLPRNKHEILWCLYFADHEVRNNDINMLIFVNSRAHAVEERESWSYNNPPPPRKVSRHIPGNIYDILSTHNCNVGCM